MTKNLIMNDVLNVRKDVCGRNNYCNEFANVDVAKKCVDFIEKSGVLISARVRERVDGKEVNIINYDLDAQDYVATIAGTNLLSEKASAYELRYKVWEMPDDTEAVLPDLMRVTYVTSTETNSHIVKELEVEFIYFWSDVENHGAYAIAEAEFKKARKNFWNLLAMYADDYGHRIFAGGSWFSNRTWRKTDKTTSTEDTIIENGAGYVGVANPMSRKWTGNDILGYDILTLTYRYYVYHGDDGDGWMCDTAKIHQTTSGLTDDNTNFWVDEYIKFDKVNVVDVGVNPVPAGFVLNGVKQYKADRDVMAALAVINGQQIAG
jgi:hypothetical protein